MRERECVCVCVREREREDRHRQTDRRQRDRGCVGELLLPINFLMIDCTIADCNARFQKPLAGQRAVHNRIAAFDYVDKRDGVRRVCLLSAGRRESSHRHNRVDQWEHGSGRSEQTSGMMAKICREATAKPAGFSPARALDGRESYTIIVSDPQTRSTVNMVASVLPRFVVCRFDGTGCHLCPDRTVPYSHWLSSVLRPES